MQELTFYTLKGKLLPYNSLSFAALKISSCEVADNQTVGETFRMVCFTAAF